MIKALFFDIDGTLMPFSTRKISENTLAALHQAKANGLHLFIASGRPPIQLQLLDESFHSVPWDGYVMMNGQFCLDENRKAFHIKAMPQEALETLVPWLKETADFCCTFPMPTGRNVLPGNFISVGACASCQATGCVF